MQFRAKFLLPKNGTSEDCQPTLTRIYGADTGPIAELKGWITTLQTRF